MNRSPKFPVFSVVALCLIVWAVGFSVPVVGQANRFIMPQYEKFTLPNGLTVYLLEKHDVPLISLSIVVPAGSVDDGDKYGIASLTAEMLMMGTQKESKDQINHRLALLGASFNSRSHRDWTRVSASFAQYDQDTVLPIIADVISNPLFDASEFDKFKERRLGELAQIKDYPSDAAIAYYVKFLFGNHSMANPVTGIESAVNSITIDDVKNFYRNQYKPAHSSLAVVGDFKTADLKVKLQTIFNIWNNPGAIPPVPDTPLPVYDKTRVLLVNDEDATETQLLAGFPIIKRNHPDYIPCLLVNNVFGGGTFTSWIVDEMRVDEGMAYSVWSTFSPYKRGGIFAVVCSTPKPIEALDIIRKTLVKLHDKGIDQKELDTAKNYLCGQFPRNYETSSQLADMFNDMYFYELDDSFINQFNETVAAMTLQKSKEIITKYYPKENLQILFIGKASELRDKVKTFGEFTEKEIKSDGY